MSEAWLARASALFQAQQWPELRQLCQATLDQANLEQSALDQSIQPPTDRANAHYFLGLAWAESEPELALNAYLEALKWVPEHPDYLRQSGHVLRRLGRTAEALSYYQQAVAHGPDSPDAWLNLLQMLKQMQAWQPLLTQLAQTQARFPKHPRLEAQAHALQLLAHRGLAEAALEKRDSAAVLQHYQAAFLALRGRPWSTAESQLSPPSAVPSSNPPLDTFLPEQISLDKLRHDLEQWHWLEGQGLLPERAQRVLPALKQWLEPALKPGSGLLSGDTLYTRQLTPIQHSQLAGLFDAPVSWPQTEHAGPLLNPHLDFEALENSYLQATTPLLWFDDLLAPTALTALNRFCLSATLWRDYYADQGYLGAFMDDGFVSPLLLNLAQALQAAWPRILGDKALHYLWGFKYGQSSQGIRLHADQAQVNFNFWLTPDSANLDPSGGGLQVYDRTAPEDWDFQAYNDQSSQGRIQAYLLHSGAQLTRIPHRQNRAVLFHSRLFHRTDPPQFKQGYENRRINVTMLFG